MDPIAELLSQLSSVRSRAAAAQSVSSQLQQLEMQLQSTRYDLKCTFETCHTFSCFPLETNFMYNNRNPVYTKPEIKS